MHKEFGHQKSGAKDSAGKFYDRQPYC